jgi:SAM-dependent methyltransferase
MALPSGVDQHLAAWLGRVAADREQVERCREVADPADFYAPVVNRFRVDPRRTDDDVLAVLLSLAQSGETWLDVGAGGGRYALPLALRVGEVIAVEPSPAMVATLREGMAEARLSNVRVVQSRWPMAREAPSAEVGLIAHIGYDIGEIGPFVSALEAATRRLCVAVMGEAAMTTVATLFWQDIHGEPRVRLPAMPELLSLLLARGRLPEVRWVDRVPSSFASVDEALAMARRQLWLREGSTKDRRLAALAEERVFERDGRFTFDERPSQIGIASWSPE